MSEINNYDQDKLNFYDYLKDQGLPDESSLYYDTVKYPLNSFIPKFEALYRKLHPGDGIIVYGLLEYQGRKRYSPIYTDRKSLERDLKFYPNSGVKISTYEKFPYQIAITQKIALSGYLTKAIDEILDHYRYYDQDPVFYYTHVIKDGHVHLTREYPFLDESESEGTASDENLI